MTNRFSRNGKASPQSDAEAGEYVKNEIDIKFDRINDLWMKVEKKLLKEQPPRRITCIYRSFEVEEYDGEQAYCGRVRRYLGIQRHAGKWRVCYASTWSKADEENLPWKPVAECDMDSRMEATDGIELLKREVANTRTTFIPKLDETIEKLERALLDEDEDESEV